MSIATELERLRSAKSALKTSITAKGVAVADSVTIDGYATLVDSIVVNGGTGGGVDTSNDTVTADVMLEGFTAHDKNGILITGTIATAPTVLFNGGLIFVTKGYVPEDYTVEVPIAVATLSANVVEVPAGWYPNPQTLTVAEAGNITVLDNVVTVPVGYIKTERTVTIPEAKAASVDGNVVTIYPGFVTKEQTIEVPSGGDIDLSGVTATADDVLEGCQFVTKDGELTEGNIPIYQISDIIPTANAVFISPGYYAGSDREITIGNAIALGTITPGTADIVLSQGSFLIEDVTIKGDANLIAANIAEGVTIFGVAGTHAGGSGGGGTDVPFPDDYLFYEPLGSAPTTAGVTLHGSPTFTTVWGIPCVNLTTNGQGISWDGGMMEDTDFASPHTVAVAFCGSNTNNGYLYFRYYKNTNSNSAQDANIIPRVTARDSVNYVSFDYGNNNVNSYTKNILVNDEWITFVATVDGDNARLYVNGQAFATTSTREFAGSAEDIRKYVIGGRMPNGDGTIEQLCVGYYANLRFYDRALTADEVMRLHQAFNPVIPFAEGKFTVTGDDYVAGTYYAEPGTKGAERRWMTAWDGTSEERMGIMLFSDGYWTICNFLATYPETPDGDWDTSQPPTWEAGYEMYRDPSLQYDEDYNIIGTPLGMQVAAPDLAGTWKSAGDPDMGSVTVVYGEYTPPDVTITDDPYKDTYWMRAKSSGTSTNVIVTKLTKQKIGLNGRPTFNNDFNTMAGTWKYGYFSDHDGWVLVDALGHDMFRSKNETTEIVGEYVGVGDYAGWTAEVSETQDGE